MLARRTLPRRGAGLVSLLVLLFILALLAALLLPAIQKVREAANKMVCANNLRQIGIAAHNYHADFGKLPPGYYGPVRQNGNTTDVSPNQANDRGPWVGVLVPLLPYVEQDNLYKQLWHSESTFPANPQMPVAQGWACGLTQERKVWWSVPQNVPLAGTKLKILKCPSDKTDEVTSTGVLSAIHIANGKFQTTFGPDSLGRTNYAGVAGTAGDFDPGIKGDFGNPAADFRQWVGVMYNRSTLTLGQITVQDGTSNTFMFGESLGGMGVGARDHAWSWMGVGAMGTAYGLGFPSVKAPVDPPPLGSTPVAGQDGAAWYRFSSRHRVVQFCWADVSTRGVRFGKTTVPDTSQAPNAMPPVPGNNPSDWALLQQLAGRKEGFDNDISRLVE